MKKRTIKFSRRINRFQTNFLKLIRKILKKLKEKTIKFHRSYLFSMEKTNEAILNNLFEAHYKF